METVHLGDIVKYLKNTATLQFFPEMCTGCLRCIEVCPRGVYVRDDRKIKVRDRDLCIECGACMKNCDYAAVRVNAGVGCAQAIINGLLRGTEPSCDCGAGGSDCC